MNIKRYFEKILLKIRDLGFDFKVMDGISLEAVYTI
jgi:hypothetical protein